MNPASCCILVAEDDEILRYCLVRLLNDLGYRVLEARDGQEALALIATSDLEIHLLITDYEMPRMNGVELSRQVTGMRPQLKMILMSGTHDSGSLRGDFVPLQKPYDDRIIANLIKDLLCGGPGSLTGLAS